MLGGTVKEEPPARLRLRISFYVLLFTQPTFLGSARRFPLSAVRFSLHTAAGMAHIHEKIDFTVAIFVVHEDKILLIHHRNLNKWLPLGGHIELDEDPETAARREAKEESGLDVELLGERPPTTGPGTRALIAPRFLDIHRISSSHEHIGMIYWARPKNGTLTLAPAEHHDIRWCSLLDLEHLQPPMDDAVKWYCRKALAEVPDPKA
jgi:8-oxo-dGTP pyrophosphatase MutT (NUDIX family)